MQTGLAVELGWEIRVKLLVKLKIIRILPETYAQAHKSSRKTARSRSWVGNLKLNHKLSSLNLARERNQRGGARYVASYVASNVSRINRNACMTRRERCQQHVTP